MAIPIEKSFLYVEPVYLQASQESKPEVETAPRMAKPSMRRPEQPTRSIALPELKRVIVAYGNEVVMKEDLASALAAIFGEIELPKEAMPMPREAVEKGSIQDLAVSVLDQYKTAQKYLKAGDWAEYGQALEKMERMLEELARAAKGVPSER